MFTIGGPLQAGVPHQTLSQHFNHAYHHGWWHAAWSALRGRPADLLDLAAIVRERKIRGEHFAGRQTVPISQIGGSEGRHNEFDAAFNPRQKHTADRWCRVARAWLEGVELGPIELVRVGDLYFVRDGHHRVSVAKAFGQHEIDAVVIEWEVDNPIARAKPANSQESCQMVLSAWCKNCVESLAAGTEPQCASPCCT